MDGIKLYFWFQGVDEKREGGPWWCRTFVSRPYSSAHAQRADLLLTLQPFLHAYAETDGTEPAFSPLRPPPANAVRILRAGIFQRAKP